MPTPSTPKAPKTLLESPTSSPIPKWMAAAGVIVGLLSFYSAYDIWQAAGLVASVVFNLFIGIVCLYGVGIRRRLYLSDVGVVREMHSWGRVIRRVLPWRDIRHVSVAYRRNDMMLFFEVGSTGWKVLFSRSQENAVRDTLDDLLPDDVEIETLGKS